MIAAGIAAMLLLFLPSMGTRADSNPNPGVIPVNVSPHGMTYGQWSAAWWQYVYSLPNSDSPLFDATGAHCAVGQTGNNVFFLAGAVSGGTQAQSCTVPAGTMLFFPVLNAEIDNGCPLVTPPMSVTDLRSSAKAAADAATSLHASIDGVAVQNVSSYRVTSPVFSFTLPATLDNLCTFFGGTVSGTTVSPAVGDGYYLMLAPLPPGQHILTFGGTFPPPFGPPPNGFTLDVTYHLTVEP
jgi:hypothetical protein